MSEARPAAGAATSAIGLRQVSKVFGSGDQRFTAVDRATVEIARNEFFTLLGPSGCGKTTLLRMIAGFEYPTAGEILLEGVDVAGLPPYARPINTVFQNYALFPHMTVAENIGFGLKMLGKPKAEVDERVAAMLKLVRMEALAGRRTSQISGGQQQRVALARALAPRPKVLLLDEPLSALDYKLRKEMQIELKRLQHETGITFIFVTHDQEEALTMSDRIAVMSAGHILQVGTPRDIYDSPADRFVADFIGETNVLAGRTGAVSGDLASVALAAGGELFAVVPAGFSRTGEVTVVVRPEHARVVASGEPATLSGTLEHAVYFGTDTHFHVRLADGSTFIVRRQNRPGEVLGVEVGDTVGVVVDPRAARLLGN
ncbi:ABC transporter ATP-binding protein [Oharaeibacter diazotrophicus]|uniref:Spermidine/putrescine import ATP-binding protein PotA n=1 Tax=Oharaeibacter diazotrophicus TaxID=1920512 RepID=A0A4R6RKX8_9HYPH|nr:ABC transporter ATP-binding protein [Oharaeibacter diazotrophicus]TDP87132.1 spermidine/putrescine transport system ATP-binding protein [Oharaeibacter diazotrophicus]BBE70925.1 spermidine/putrescine import ATP-binding protein PotA [Pleomorphomonas sp. SM30]GLS77674.1 spermidine/putrescine import ATP-binding protein PotA [Oharaeibacter diazotrophicus]